MRYVAWCARLSAVVVLAVGAAACGDANTASETQDSTPIVATTKSLGSNAEPATVGSPLYTELLTAEDMPAAGSWNVMELPAEFWDPMSDSFSVHICDPFGMSLWTIAPPADAEHRVGRMLVSPGQGSVKEAVFSGDNGELNEVFQAVTQGLTDCLEGPGDPNMAEVGYDLDVEELPAAGVGEAEFLIRQRLYYQQSDPTMPFCDHRLAVVLDGTRLVMVEHNRGGVAAVASNPLVVSNDDFAQMVQNAAQRIAS